MRSHTEFVQMVSDIQKVEELLDQAKKKCFNQNELFWQRRSESAPPHELQKILDGINDSVAVIEDLETQLEEDRVELHRIDNTFDPYRCLVDGGIRV